MATEEGNFIERLKQGETFYMSVSGKKKGLKRQGVNLGHDASYKDLMAAVGGVAVAHGFTKIRVSFSRNIMADSDGYVTFDINLNCTVKEERIY